MNLELADFVRVSGRDAASGGAAGFVAEDVDTVVFPGQVEDAVGDVADHAAFVDEQAREDRDTNLLEWQCFPEGLAWVGDDTGAEGEASDIMFGDATGE